MKITTKKIRIAAVESILIFGLVIALSFAGCTTYVPINSVRMPTIDTSNIQRLAIKPFENKSGVNSPVTAQLVQYMTDKAIQQISAAGKFIIVAPTDPNADGIFTGEIQNIVSKDSQEQKERKNKNGDVIVYIMYKREVSLGFSYSIISSRTDMPIGIVNKQSSQSDINMEETSVSDTLTLAKRIADSQMSGIRRDIVPSIVSSSRPLMNETLKDKVVKQRMKTAMLLVKNHNYTEAINQFDEIANEYGSVAAMTNAALLRESIASEIAARDRLTELFNDTSGLSDKAIKNTIDVLNSKLPPEATIMIIKTRSTERNMLNYVVEQMTKNIVQAARLKVVDRSNQALIEAEQQYQLSGNVSDDSIVSIGHQLGVQYMVLCWISGEKSLRRLNLRVLNIETAQITEQTDFEI